ncbi:hypothetical protein N0V90_009843 [Kalmusia sp. IMI 367209]|nr:hypothetical protein N0V90_009843 [Kalmusia sp. IMI 367209]
MAPGLPYSRYTHDYHGPPTSFLIGPSPSPMSFDVHTTLLAQHSPIFNNIYGRPKTIADSIVLPSATPDEFLELCFWLYEKTPPKFSGAHDLGRMCRLWVVAAKLGLWQKMNTLLRLGMELMQPREFKCDVGVVRWVFGNTAEGSPLRGFIIAIFCQRCEPDINYFFLRASGDEDIFREASAFLKDLEVARRRYAVGRVASAWASDGKKMPVFSHKVISTGGVGSDAEYPLPRYLVWDYKGVDLPDAHFVLPYGTVLEDGLADGLKSANTTRSRRNGGIISS